MRSVDTQERARAFEQELRKQRAYADHDRAQHEAMLEAMISKLDSLNLESSVRDDVVREMNLFPLHSHVAFKGLKARPDLNGKRGKIVGGFDAERRRFIVHCERHIGKSTPGDFDSAFDGEQVLVKPANLVISRRLPAFLGIAAGGLGKTDVSVVCSWLDTCGGDLEARHPAHNDTMLTLSVCTGDTGLVAELLRRGADVEATARNGTTALMYAAHDGAMPMVTKLLAAGADSLRLDNFGFTAADKAYNGGHVEVERTLRNAVLREGATAAADSVMYSPSSQGDPSKDIRLKGGTEGVKLSTGSSLERQSVDAGEDTYLQKIVKATACSGVDKHQAATLLQEAITLDAARGEAYFNLGWLLLACLDVRASLAAFEQAVERWAEDGPHPDADKWGLAISTSFLLRNSPVGKGHAHPSYGFDDVSLIEMSGLVVTAAPSAPESWEMRASILAGFLEEGKRKRSLAQYREAARCYKRSAELAKVTGQAVGDKLEKASLCDRLGAQTDEGKPLMSKNFDDAP